MRSLPPPESSQANNGLNEELWSQSEMVRDKWMGRRNGWEIQGILARVQCLSNFELCSVSFVPVLWLRQTSVPEIGTLSLCNIQMSLFYKPFLVAQICLFTGSVRCIWIVGLPMVAFRTRLNRLSNSPLTKNYIHFVPHLDRIYVTG